MNIGEMSIEELCLFFKNDFDEVYNSGKKISYDLFWDNFQKKGNRKSYEYAFISWHEKSFYPKYDIIIGVNSSGADESGSAVSTFRRFNSNIINSVEQNTPVDLSQRFEDCGVIFNTSLVKAFTYTFSFSNISRIPVIDMSSASSMGYMCFYYSRNLETIDKIILKNDGSQTGNDNNFAGLGKLKNIIFEGVIGSNINFKDSPLLTKSSIISIINALSNEKGATLTLSQTAVNNAFGSIDSQEWIDLIISKSNNYNGLWTITLV